MAFDDVVVKYDPPVARSGPHRISAEYHQVKWHVEMGGRFGYVDFIEPDFIGARSFSLLERLQQAQQTAPASAQFTFLTTYRVRDGDPLASLISAMTRRSSWNGSSTARPTAAAWEGYGSVGGNTSSWEMTNSFGLS